MNRINLFVIFLFHQTQLGSCKKYSNYTLFRGMPVNKNHVEFFRNISEIYEVNFWRPPGLPNMPIEFTITPKHQKKFQREAEEKGIYLTTIMKDVQSAFDKQTVQTYIRRNLASYNWDNFFRLNDIYSWLRDLENMHPNQMKIVKIGLTQEHRKILAVKIKLGNSTRSKVIIEGGIHAREWISPAFVTYMIQEILHAPNSNDPQLRKIASTYEWWFLPVVNPDGYEYSHTDDRLWRKNRAIPDGVDLNRNFNMAFATVGVSHNSYSDIYCGPHPFSEKETYAMSRFIEANSKNLEYYIGFHSYGQYMIIPYAHRCDHVQNYDEVEKMATESADIIRRRYNTKYYVGTAYDTVGYKTSGVSSCWVKHNFGVPYVITFELRDQGDFGFALPPNQILPTCKETMDGLISFLVPRTAAYSKIVRQQIPNRTSQIFYEKSFLNILLFIIFGFY